MKATMNACTRSTLSAVFVLVTVSHALSQNTAENQSPDKKVRGFLESHRSQWHDMNIPAADGKILYDLIVTNGYTKALEIGTSTGHSGIWIAWALSKTGGNSLPLKLMKIVTARRFPILRKRGSLISWTRGLQTRTPWLTGSKDRLILFSAMRTRSGIKITSSQSPPNLPSEAVMQPITYPANRPDAGPVDGEAGNIISMSNLWQILKRQIGRAHV